MDQGVLGTNRLNRRRVLALGGAACLAAPIAALGQDVPASAAGDAAALRLAFAAARAGDRAGVAAALPAIADPDARRLALWMFADALGDQLSFAEIDPLRRDLSAWPRADRRQALAEKAIAAAALAPAEVAAWFGAQAPATAEGALALASALDQLGRSQDAIVLIRRFWRERLFGADVQQAMLAAYGARLDADDHIRRLDALLMGPQGPVAEAMLPLVPPDWQALAQARVSLRADRPDVAERLAAVPPSLAADPGLAFEQARWLRSKDRMTEGFALLARFPTAPPHEDGQVRLYQECRLYFVEALARAQFHDAYAIMAGRGFPGGTRRAEAEFFAGWAALAKLGDAGLAAPHFQAVWAAGTSPLTQSRALYWLGRTAEAQGRAEIARTHYREGAQYVGAFYGQLCAEKAGRARLVLPADPQPTEAERAGFSVRPLVRAADWLRQIDERDLFKVFVARQADALSQPQDFALLMDAARAAGEPFAAMTVGRTAATRGMLLPERMYPVIDTAPASGAPEPALTLAITRQESSFDPRARTATARGMMMLRPETARTLARAAGLPYADAMLWESDYNMRLGQLYLGQMLTRMGGSYLLAAAAYNAGPSRPPRWIVTCGDPRAGADPVDFIESVPYGETRDYMMRVMENLQVYRARLGGGAAPLTLSADLRRSSAAG